MWNDGLDDVIVLRDFLYGGEDDDEEMAEGDLVAMEQLGFVDPEVAYELTMANVEEGEPMTEEEMIAVQEAEMGIVVPVDEAGEAPPDYYGEHGELIEEAPQEISFEEPPPEYDVDDPEYGRHHLTEKPPPYVSGRKRRRE